MSYFYDHNQDAVQEPKQVHILPNKESNNEKKFIKAVEYKMAPFKNLVKKCNLKQNSNTRMCIQNTSQKIRLGQRNMLMQSMRGITLDIDEDGGEVKSTSREFKELPMMPSKQSMYMVLSKTDQQHYKDAAQKQKMKQKKSKKSRFIVY